jgi:hypothetical protein
MALNSVKDKDWGGAKAGAVDARCGSGNGLGSVCGF